MTELSRDDLKWLEDRFKDYPNYDRQIAMRKIELDMKQHDENIGGGKSNITVKTIEVKVIKYLSDPYIASREKWKRAAKSPNSSFNHYRNLKSKKLMN